MYDCVRVRFAPSPTGELHVGGARTALYCYLFAQQHKINTKTSGGCQQEGKQKELQEGPRGDGSGADQQSKPDSQSAFILRIEDTDDERSSMESLRSQLQDLKWLGLEWDEGPQLCQTQDTKKESTSAEDLTEALGATNITQRGSFGPYLQSQRLDIYKEHANQLLNAGKAYYCFLTDDEIEQQRHQDKNQLAHDVEGVAAFSGEVTVSEGGAAVSASGGASPKTLGGFQVRSPYREWSLQQAREKIAQGASAVVRFKHPGLGNLKTYTLNDIVRGRVQWPAQQVGDFVLMRSNGKPVYNFACVVDDHLMKISHVFRSEEHLNNTLRQLMLYEAFDWPRPKFAHMSLILDKDRKKLSKRRLPSADTVASNYTAESTANAVVSNYTAESTANAVVSSNPAENTASAVASNNLAESAANHNSDSLAIDISADEAALSPQRVSVRDFREAGYYPPALLNGLALLGWTHPQEKEILSMAELIENFRLEKLHKSPAVLSETFLIFLNQRHLSDLASGTQEQLDELWNLLKPKFKKYGLQFAKGSCNDKDKSDVKVSDKDVKASNKNAVGVDGSHQLSQWHYKALQLFGPRLVSLSDSAALEVFLPLAVGTVKKSVEKIDIEGGDPIALDKNNAIQNDKVAIADIVLRRFYQSWKRNESYHRQHIDLMGQIADCHAQAKSAGACDDGTPEQILELEQKISQDLKNNPQPLQPLLPAYCGPYTSKCIIEMWRDFLQHSASDFLSADECKSIQKNIQKKYNVKGPQLFHPLRWCIIGFGEGPGLKDLATLIPRRELLARADAICARLKRQP